MNVTTFLKWANLLILRSLNRETGILHALDHSEGIIDNRRADQPSSQIEMLEPKWDFQPNSAKSKIPAELERSAAVRHLAEGMGEARPRASPHSVGNEKHVWRMKLRADGRRSGVLQAPLFDSLISAQRLELRCSCTEWIRYAVVGQRAHVFVPLVLMVAAIERFAKASWVRTWSILSMAAQRSTDAAGLQLDLTVNQ